MEAKECLLQPLLERAEEYGKTSLKLVKLKFLDRTSDFISTFVSRAILTVVLTLFAFAFNVAIGLWLGDLMGKTYLGFLTLASFYALLAIGLLFLHSYIKGRVTDVLIKKALA